MHVLLVHLKEQANDAAVRRERIVECDRLTIGRATDQIIHSQHAAVEAEHATITGRGGKLTLKSKATSGVLVNDKATRKAALNVGDTVKIANLALEVLPAGEHDACLSVITAAVEHSEAELSERYSLNLNSAGLNNRRWAWAWFLGVAGLFMLLPLLVILQPELGKVLRSTPLPDDGAWLSGPLHGTHQFIGDRCEACHVEPFVQVRDQECLLCHTETQHHADPHEFDMAGVEEIRCGVCHQEHHEPGALINTSEKFCTDCHADFEKQFPKSKLANVAGFEANHPQFKVRMQIPGGEQPQWTSLDDPSLADPSGIKFPHGKHLKPEGIKAPDGEQILNCDSCHIKNRGGFEFAPINFEQNCQSCHALDFEADVPNRQVPHGNAEQVTQTLNEFYAARFLDGLQVKTEAGPDRRRPGKESREAALLAASEAANRAADELFSSRVCRACHDVSRNEAGDWQVAPVELTNIWMPKASFDHEPHKTTDCESCHQASSSEVASDVLMPGIANCQQCHGDSDSSNLLPTGCAGCHSFHTDGQPLMSQQAGHLPMKPLSKPVSKLLNSQLPNSQPSKAKPAATEEL